MMYQGLLGYFPFTVTEAEVCTFRDLARSRESTYATHEVLLDKPRLQHTGQNLDTFSMNVLIAPLNGLSTIGARLRILDAIIEAGQELPLVIGLRWYGLYVLKTCNVTHRTIHFGVTLAADVSLSLQEYN